MLIDSRVFWLQKEGCSPEEYEDAYSLPELSSAETNVFRCAVADGATETSFSGLWAKILVDGYVNGIESLSDMQADWWKQVAGKDLPWYAEQKLEFGAYAAFVGLKIESSEVGDSRALKWSATALGDCCLFHVRDGKLLQALPLDRWQQFNNTPLLLSSKADANADVLPKTVNAGGELQSGDIFYLMSDAISNWFLHRHAEKQDATMLLEQVCDQDEFAKIVTEQRSIKDESGRALMPNDDVTVIRAVVQ